MHTLFIKDLIQLFCLLRVSNIQLFILRQIGTCSFMVFYTDLYKQSGHWFLLHMYITMHGSKNVKCTVQVNQVQLAYMQKPCQKFGLSNV
jgi:hypothetical protein